jgi:acetyl-CoA carboxylase biotin carboxyl carrier protein
MEGKYKQIAEVLNLFERSDLTVMFVEFDGVRLSVSKKDGVPVSAPWEALSAPSIALTSVAAAPIAQPASPPALLPKQITTTAAQPDPTSLEGLQVVRAPMLGTIYRSPSPGEPPFVAEGAQVKADQTLCLIECMKLFNTIAVGVSGRLVHFAVENATMVEFNQPIAYVQPD